MKNGIKIIVVGGLYRSGSVWQYNVIRTILELAGYSCGFSGINPDWSKIKTDYHILKLHKFYPQYYEIADYVFSSIRNIEHARRSRERFSGRKINRRRLIITVNWCYQWMRRADYIMFFDDIFDNKAKIVNAIKSILGFSEVYTAEVIKKVNAIRPPKTGQDPVTMLFANHITSKANYEN